MKTVAVTRWADKEIGDKGKIEVVDFPMPVVGPTDVLVKVAYCSICGSDPHILASGKAIGWKTPFGLGHETSGIVAELGPKATISGLKVGDRVCCQFFKACGVCINCRHGRESACLSMADGCAPGMAEYIVCDEQQVFKIPDTLPLEEACLVEPLAIAVRAIETAKIPEGGTVAISGGGSLGLMILQLAKLSGASTVTVIEPMEEKLKLAAQLGADYCINPRTDDVMAEAMKITGDYGFSSVIESSGAPAATKPAMAILAPGGTAVMFAMYPTDYEMPLNLFQDIYWNEKTVTGFFNSSFHTFPQSLALMPKVNMKALIHKVFPLDDAVAAFEAQATGKYAKILIKCS